MHRPLCLVLVLTLAGCGKGGEQAQASAPTDSEIARDVVSCALGGSAQFRDDCTAERSESEGESHIVVHHPDGGFRRLVVAKDGLTLESADGAEATRSARKGDRFEVILGQDRYVIAVAGPDRAPAR